LNVIDDFNREALWIEVDTSLPAERVVRVLEQLLAWRGKPTSIRMDNGPNRTYREEVLDAYLFDDLQEVRYITER
jgi:putative transposase